MTKVSEVSNINPRRVVLPITLRCLCTTDVGSTCACRVSVPIFKAMMNVAIAQRWDMRDSVFRVSAAVETRCVRARGLVGIVNEGGEGRIAGARLAHGVNRDVVEDRGKLCCGERSERAA